MVNYNNIIENLPYGLCIIDNDLIIQLYNAKFSERFNMLFGCRAENGNAICSNTNAEFKSQILSYCAQALAGVESKYTHTFKTNGTETIIQITFKPNLTKDDEINGALLITDNITKNIELLGELKESEEKHKRLIENLSDNYLFFTHDTKGEFTYISPSVKNLLGYSQEEVLSRSSLIFKTKSEVNIKAAKILKKAYQGIKNPPYEVELIAKNGKLLHFEISEVPIKDAKNKVIAIEGVAHNITDQKKSVDDLQLREKKYRNLFEQSNDAIIIRTLDGKILDINNKTCQMLGYSREQLLKMTVIDFQPKSQKYKVTKGIEIVKNSGNLVIESFFEKSNGEVINVEISSRVVNKEIGTVQSIARDITKQKDAEQSLKDQKDELQTTVEYLKETQSQLVQSEKMAALGQLIAGIAHEINTPLGAINASINNISDSLKNVLFNLPHLLRRLKEGEISFFFKILQAADNKLHPLSSKERRRKKKEIIAYFSNNGIQEAERVADNFMYLKIYDNAQEFLPYLKKDDAIFIIKSARNFASLIKNRNNIKIAIEKAAKIVFALKKFAHKDHIGDKVSTDIIDGMETVITLYHNKLKHGIDVIRKYSEIPNILCYSDEINQIWTNLINNAIQAMTDTGTLTIEIKADSENIYVNIGDTGSGIPDEIHDKIFMPFFTTKMQGEGSGLGLDIVSQIIEKHNGKISFSSQAGIGTTFHITLPIN